MRTNEEKREERKKLLKTIVIAIIVGLIIRLLVVDTIANYIPLGDDAKFLIGIIVMLIIILPYALYVERKYRKQEEKLAELEKNSRK